MTVTALTAQDVELTESQEGYRSERYWDPYGRVWTIGFGTTSASGVFPNGVVPLYCTVSEATGWLLEYMNRAVIPSLLRVFAPVNGNELSALADLGYNAGADVFFEEPMYSALRSGDREAIASAFMAFDRAGGQVLSDLVHRREADRARFLAPVPHVPTYHYDWYPKKWQVAIKRYDALRALEHVGKLTKRDAVWLKARQKQCGLYATFVIRKARRVGSRKHPNWDNHRGWMFQELRLRAEGKRVLPQ